MGAYANRRTNYMPFVNGAIFASMGTVQPRWIDAHEAFYSLRLYNIYSLSRGVLEGSSQVFCGSHTHPCPNRIDLLHLL